MDAIVAPNTVPLAQVTAAPSGPVGYPIDPNPALLIPGTTFPAYHYAGIIIELLTVIRGAGLTPDRTNNQQLLAAIQGLIGNAVNNGFPAWYVELLATGSLTVPPGAGHIEAILDGAGGGGGPSYGENISGGGGGAGGHVHAVWAVTSGQTVTLTVGAPGAPQGIGGDTILALNNVMIATAYGGNGATVAGLTSAGAAGGGYLAVNPAVIVMQQVGGCGSDGISQQYIGLGNGASGFYGGGGRAGNGAGTNGTGYGAGGGGSYGTAPGNGGYGGPGRFAYRWLP